MSKNNVIDLKNLESSPDLLTELLRQGARKLIQQAVETELESFLAQYSDKRTEEGHQAVTRNGYLPERDLQTSLGPVTVRIPKVRSKNGNPVTFRSALVPPYVRKTKTLEAALPWLYLKGVSSGETEAALKVLPVHQLLDYHQRQFPGLNKLGRLSTMNDAHEILFMIAGFIFGLMEYIVVYDLRRPNFAR